MAEEVFYGRGLHEGFASGLLCVEPRDTGGMPRLVGPGQGAAVEGERFRWAADRLGVALGNAVRDLDPHSPAAGILETHILMLEDEGFRRRVSEALETGQSAELSVDRVLQGYMREFASSGSPMLAAREADLEDLRRQLQAELMQERVPTVEEWVGAATNPVLAVVELLPSIALRARSLGAAGVVVTRGTALSHGIILASAAGLPVIRVQGLESLREFEGRPVFVDGDAGDLLVEPIQQEIEARRARRRPEREPAATGGTPLPVRLWVNIASPTELEQLDWTDIEGVGLYRSEALYLQESEAFPGEEKLLAVYSRLFHLAGDRPVVVRTVDLGGDKRIPYMTMGPQENPYLGLRGPRLFHFHPEILVTQLRAILQAAAGPHRVRILHPMVETVDQWRFLRTLLERAVSSLRNEGLAFQEKFQLGVMIETPSAVWSFRHLLDEVDFASLGTNDLVQYLFAVERDNANVSRFYTPAHPVVLGILRELADQARDRGKALSLCGEIASDPALLPVLVGMGIDLSVAASRSRLVRSRLRQLDSEACRQLADGALAARTEHEIDDLLHRRGDEPLQGELDEAVDPVCGMVVIPGDGPLTLEEGDVHLHFCSLRCLDLYRNRHSTTSKGSP